MDSEYTFAGTGVAGPKEIWYLGKPPARGKGVTACYEAVKLDPRCEKDYFTYITRETGQPGNKKCGCKGDGSALSVKLDTRRSKLADYFKIDPEGMQKFVNILCS